MAGDATQSLLAWIVRCNLLHNTRLLTLHAWQQTTLYMNCLWNARSLRHGAPHAGAASLPGLCLQQWPAVPCSLLICIFC
jgi:hypothetical protein